MIVPPQYREGKDQSDQYSDVRSGVPEPVTLAFTGGKKHEYPREDEKHMVLTQRGKPETYSCHHPQKPGTAAAPDIPDILRTLTKDQFHDKINTCQPEDHQWCIGLEPARYGYRKYRAQVHHHHGPKTGTRGKQSLGDRGGRPAGAGGGGH